MLKGLQKDDVVVLKSLDRLSLRTMDLLEITKEIEDKGATLKVLDKDKGKQFFYFQNLIY